MKEQDSSFSWLHPIPMTESCCKVFLCFYEIEREEKTQKFIVQNKKCHNQNSSFLRLHLNISVDINLEMLVEK